MHGRVFARTGSRCPVEGEKDNLHRKTGLRESCRAVAVLPRQVAFPEAECSALGQIDHRRDRARRLVEVACRGDAAEYEGDHRGCREPSEQRPTDPCHTRRTVRAHGALTDPVQFTRQFTPHMSLQGRVNTEVTKWIGYQDFEDSNASISTNISRPSSSATAQRRTGAQSRPSLSPTASCAGPKSSTIVPGQALSPATPARTTTFEPTAGFGGVFDDPAITRIMPSVERNDRANMHYPHRTNVVIRVEYPFCVVLSSGNDFAHAGRRGRRGSRIGETMVGQRSASFSRA